MTRWHTAALALVGWYLLYPPTARDLDSRCKGESKGTMAEIQRCNILRNKLVAEAPLAEWSQVGEFDTVEAFHAQLDENLHPYETRERWWQLARWELKAEGSVNPSNRQLSTRAAAMARVAVDERTAGKCIASDDPRLKGK